jgi:heme/copper-type cytochrome/quinol oxidase subunit 2
VNTLSWLLYLADVSGTLSVVVGLSALVLGITAVILNVVASVHQSNGEYSAKEYAATKPYARGTLIAAPILLLLACVVPSEDTVYAIAVSEMGEEVLKSETASKAQRALNAWLDKQIGETKVEGDEK